MRLLALAACLFLATSCTRDDTSGAAAGSDTTGAAANGQDTTAATASGRPATLADTIRIEGTPEPMTLTLVESPPGFPMTFSTYMPPDMQSEFKPDSAAVQFTAAFGGTVQPKAYVRVQRIGGGIANVRADSLVAQMLARGGFEGLELLAGAPPWANDGAGFSYTENGTRYNGSVAVRSEGSTPFRIIVHMPSEYGDGMGPRMEMLLRHWLWSDGTPLIP